MNEEKVRTEEENRQYQVLIQHNRQRRQLLKKQMDEITQLSIPQVLFLKSMRNINMF